MTIAHLAEDQGDFGENPGCMSCLVLLARGFERIYPGGGQADPTIPINRG